MPSTTRGEAAVAAVLQHQQLLEAARGATPGPDLDHMSEDPSPGRLVPADVEAKVEPGGEPRQRSGRCALRVEMEPEILDFGLDLGEHGVGQREQAVQDVAAGDVLLIDRGKIMQRGLAPGIDHDPLDHRRPVARTLELQRKVEKAAAVVLNQPL